MRTLRRTSLIAILVITSSCSQPAKPGQETSTPVTEANRSQTSQVTKAEESKSDANLVVITGTLLKQDRSPLPNIELWIGSAERRGKRLAVKVEFYKGMVVLPGATTGPDGRFEIRMNRDFFKPGQEYAIAAKEDPIRRTGGGVLNTTFKIESGSGRIELGEIVSNLN
jgi:hypothetical protein